MPEIPISRGPPSRRALPVSPSQWRAPDERTAPAGFQASLPGLVGMAAGCSSGADVCTMFSVDDATAEAIRQVFEKSGELSAAIELRRYFPRG